MLKNCFVLTFAFLCFSQTLKSQVPNLIKDSVYSFILKEQRDLLIYIPTELIERKDTSIHYPVLYVLDGSSHFLSVSGLVNELAETSNSYTLPKMIVVFIKNTKRTRDLTPYPISTSNILPEEVLKITGGAEDFTACIEKEIIPHIESLYPVTPYRALIGHSLGGIFALNVLAKHKEIFDDYLVIDPSTWYDYRKFSNQVLTTLAKHDYKDKSLFIAIANTTNQKDTSLVKKAKDLNSEHERSILEFNSKIKLIKNNLKYASKYYPEDDHRSVPTIAKYDGLRFFFKGLKFSLDELLAPEYQPRKEIIKYYDHLSKKLKYNIPIPTAILETCYKEYADIKDLKRQNEVLGLYQERYPEKAEKFVTTLKK
jgi:predicted alpha/beta superfamily hydrolase